MSRLSRVRSRNSSTPTSLGELSRAHSDLLEHKDEVCQRSDRVAPPENDQSLCNFIVPPTIWTQNITAGNDRKEPRMHGLDDISWHSTHMTGSRANS